MSDTLLSRFFREMRIGSRSGATEAQKAFTEALKLPVDGLPVKVTIDNAWSGERSGREVSAAIGSLDEVARALLMRQAVEAYRSGSSRFIPKGEIAWIGRALEVEGGDVPAIRTQSLIDWAAHRMELNAGPQPL